MKKRILTFLVLMTPLIISSCGGSNPSSEEPSSVAPSSEPSPSSEPAPSSEAPSSVTPSSEEGGLPHISGDFVLPDDIEQDNLGYVAIHYQRPDGKYNKWNLWLWGGNEPGDQFDFNYTDDWGYLALYGLSNFGEGIFSDVLGFIVKKGVWEAKDVNDDRFVDLEIYVADEYNVHHLYLVSKDPEVYYDSELHTYGYISDAYFSSSSMITVKSNKIINSYKLYEGDLLIVDKNATGEKKQINIPKQIDFRHFYRVEVALDNGQVISKEVDASNLYGSDEFGDLYNYDGKLGAYKDGDNFTFRVWSPFASKIMLNIYDTGTPASLGGSDEKVLSLEMDKGEKGTFEKTFTNQDFTGKYYTYSVNNGKFVDKEIIDPYALSAGVNGIRGYIPNFENDNPTGWDEVNYLNYDRKELTVWETHVADVTSSVTWTGTEANRKIFKGMYESGTTYTGTNGVKVKTGFDHIKELGVNAVQIVPLYDQDNDEINMEFNWGYNPLNYNVIEGGYSSNPYDGDVRIREFKELVQAYNKEGISIIMDVVYNHVMSVEGRNFDVLMPHYYFRYSAGKLTNGSGCGNETASEHYMYRKFMIDSVCFWLKEYKLGGFRFDLMGLHDLETMNLLVEEAKKINPDVVIYGEPWTGETTPLPANKQAAQANLSKMVGYGGFNDQLRDNLINGGLNAPSDLGYITNVNKATQGNMNRLIDGFRGITSASTSKDPNHAINYVTCHDNYTLYDRFLATGAFDPVKNAKDLVRMNVLSNAIVFTTQGTSFMLAGEEFLRTKGGDDDSYKSSYEVNELNYELKAQHMDMIEAYQKLIALKQNLASLHLEKEDANAIVVNHSENFATAYFNLVEGDNEYIIMHTNGVGDKTVYDLSGYTLYYSTTQGNGRVLNDSVTLDRFETLIAYRPIDN